METVKFSMKRFLNTAALVAMSVMGMAQVSVTTYHYDNYRTGLNPNETVLNPTNVNPNSFGLLWSLPTDGQVYAQPLYLPRVRIPGKGIHNVVFIATQHNTLYAYDADSNTGANATPLWQVNFGPSIPYWETGSGDISPEIGITSTPVIHKLRNGTLAIYVVAKTKTLDANNNAIYTQKVHVLNTSTGAELLKGPFTIQGQVPGTGDGSVNGIVAFNPLIQHARPSLLIVENTNNKDATLYVTFASHGDNGPYHGWIFMYDAELMSSYGIVNTTPNANTDPSGYPLAAGGIWQGGAGPASDGKSIYFSTGNGMFDATKKSFGDSILRYLVRSYTVADYFTPSNQGSLNDYDEDLGSGGVMLIPPSATGTKNAKYLVHAGKEGTIRLIDTTKMGKYSANDNITQTLGGAIGGVWGAPAFWNNNIYFGAQSSQMTAFQIANGQFTTTSPTSYTNVGYGYPGPTPSVSSAGNTNAIVWAIQADNWGNGGPGALQAYDATNLSNTLYDSNATGGRDTMGPAIKFTTPVVVNGKVYAGTGDSVAVFGLGTWAPNPVINPASGTFNQNISVTVTDTNPSAKIYYTTDGTTPTNTSKLYSGAVTLTDSCVFQARAYVAGMSPSGVVSSSYLIKPSIGTGTGLTGNYFNNTQTAGGTPTFSELDPLINFNWNGGSPAPGVDGSNWAGEWTGQIQAETTGTYTFTTVSDDGVVLTINGQTVVNAPYYMAPTAYSGTINLVKGQKYKIDITYFQGGGGSVLQLFWSAPGLVQQLVPTSQMYSK